MALFTDGPLSGLEDLTAQDTQLTNVANVAGIDVTRKAVLAQEELELELRTLLGNLQRAEQAFWLAPRATIHNVAVTPPLRLWHTFRTLEMVYRDASVQLNDRYAMKGDQFQEQAQRAYEKLLLLGIGMVWSPVPRGAQPQVLTAQGDVPDGTYYVSMAWINNKGEEGAPSIPTTVATVSSTFLVQPGKAPECAGGWNVYVGTDPGAMSIQNPSPIGLSQIWLQPGTITTAGRLRGTGQSPTYMMPMPRLILRG
jgi:hypothetical protein